MVVSVLMSGYDWSVGMLLWTTGGSLILFACYRIIKANL